MKIIWILVLITTVINWPTTKVNPCLDKIELYQTLDLNQNEMIKAEEIHSIEIQKMLKDYST